MYEAQTTHADPVGTATPYPLTKVFDLNPEMTQRDKAKAIVLQVDGTYYAIWYSFGKYPTLKNKDDKIVFIEPPRH